MNPKTKFEGFIYCVRGVKLDAVIKGSNYARCFSAMAVSTQMRPGIIRFLSSCGAIFNLIIEEVK